ncbi:type I restriction endonuclease subunit R [Campylobacter sp. Cr9]|uniref:type I restriction endonuclease subunit R n=1 Tax=Campylobacter sp. Cr9 TaxID=2735728 RepID=UPI0030157DE9|nr:type I restriction endonuclease subunit R [Campylobacter sp. Cr9]
MIKPSEKDYESYIERHLLNQGYIKRTSQDYNKTFGLDEEIFFAYLNSVYPKELSILSSRYQDYKNKILNIIKNIPNIDYLNLFQKSIKLDEFEFKLFSPKPNNTLNSKLCDDYSKNIFSCIRQLYFSNEDSESIDLVIFINGLSIATIELKYELTGQNIENAKTQYKKRNADEIIFRHSLMHFAMDSSEVYLSLKIQGNQTKFIPFNKGLNDGKAALGVKTGAGNPAINNDYKTSYLWKRMLSKDTLSDIIINYMKIIKDKETKEKRLIYPRYHQFDVVDKLCKDVKEFKSGKRYLIQHSAGSGKSNSIAWLTFKLSNLHVDNKALFDAVIVITDRVVLDNQIQSTISSFNNTKGYVESIRKGSKQLKQALEENKRIIISTIQKFPYIIKDLASLDNKNYALIIDEAHSSQDGKTASSVNSALSNTNEECFDIDDLILDEVNKAKYHKNISYFAFTATPKKRTLETFGTQIDESFYPFHLYSMQQAIEEGYILDVLQNYTSYKSFFELSVKGNGNKVYDESKAMAKLVKFATNSAQAIEQKSQIILKHFMANTLYKINNQAKAMVVADDRLSALRYYLNLKELFKDYKIGVLVAFSGELKLDDVEYTERSLNGFSENNLPKEFKKDENKILVVANKYQTGFDEPLLHTMYLDKVISDVAAVQTLSRLNRTKNGKIDTCVIDFANNYENIQNAFSRYCEFSCLEKASDPNELYELYYILLNYGVFNEYDVSEFIELYYEYIKDAIKVDYESMGANICSYLDRFSTLIGEKGLANEFYKVANKYINNYEYLNPIMDIDDVKLEKLSIFLKYLICKIQRKTAQDIKDLLDNVRLQKFNVKFQGTTNIELASNPTIKQSGIKIKKSKEEQLEELVKIIKNFNDIYKDNDNKTKEILNTIIEELENDSLLKSSFTFNYDENNAKKSFYDSLEKISSDLYFDYQEFFNALNIDKEFKKVISNKLFNNIKENFLSI